MFHIFSKKQLFSNWLFFCLTFVAIIKSSFSWLGLLFAILLFIRQTSLFKKTFDRYHSIDFKSSALLLFSFHISALSVIYYIFGLTKISIITWLAFSLAGLSIYSGDVKFETTLFKKISPHKTDFVFFIALFYIFAEFIKKPILDGSPSPWTTTPNTVFAIFFILTFFIIYDYFNKKLSPIAIFAYLFVSISIVACKYILSFGYDSLLHQASLEYIAKYEQIHPLTPFYIGQYVIEIFINFTTGWSFIFIERWLSPALFLVLVGVATQKLLLETKKSTSLILIPISSLFLFNQFYFSSPYNTSLIWCIVAVSYLYIFLINKNKADYFVAVSAAVASAFTHPFIGIGALICTMSAYYLYKAENARRKKIILIKSFLLLSFATTACFGLYSWLNGGELTLLDPVYFFTKFLNVFGDPVWYAYDSPSFGLKIIYFYEKIYYLIIILTVVAFLLRDKKNSKANYFIVLSATGFFVSSWLFSSLIEVSGYTYEDQINYSYRLLLAAKWVLWPVVVLTINDLLGRFSNKTAHKILFSISLSVILLANWYLSYPRYDQISKMNVNNIREIDYKATDFIYQREGGKFGYLVLANQIFGAAAIKKYGFGPYYGEGSEKIFYYSIPTGSNLSQLYEQIMSAEKFNLYGISEAMKKANVDKLYLIITDYWSPSDEIKKEIEREADGHWNIENKIDIYHFIIKTL